MHRKQKIRRLDIDYRSRNTLLVAASALAVVIAVCLTIIFTSSGTNATTGPHCSMKDTGPVPTQLANDRDYCFIKKVTKPTVP